MEETFSVSDRVIVGQVLQAAGATQVPRGDIQEGFGKIPAFFIFNAPPPNGTTLMIPLSLVDGQPTAQVIQLIRTKISAVNQEAHDAL